MNVTQVDEFETRSEAIATLFKAYLFEGSSFTPEENTSWATDSYDLSDCDVIEALQWCAEESYPDKSFALGLVTARDSTGDSVVWIAGHDLNDTLLSPLEETTRRAMESRLGKRITLA